MQIKIICDACGKPSAIITSIEYDEAQQNDIYLNCHCAHCSHKGVIPLREWIGKSLDSIEKAGWAGDAT